MKNKQTNFFDYCGDRASKKRYGRLQHGGSQKKAGRKLERPLSTKKSIHLVLKSDKARGKYSFLLPRNQQTVEEVLRAKARKFGH